MNPIVVSFIMCLNNPVPENIKPITIEMFEVVDLSRTKLTYIKQDGIGKIIRMAKKKCAEKRNLKEI